MTHRYIVHNSSSPYPYVVHKHTKVCNSDFKKIKVLSIKRKIRIYIKYSVSTNHKNLYSKYLLTHTINDIKKTETVDQHSSHLYTSKYSDNVHVLLYYRVVVQFQYTLMCEDAQKHPINFI